MKDETIELESEFEAESYSSRFFASVKNFLQKAFFYGTLIFFTYNIDVICSTLGIDFNEVRQEAADNLGLKFLAPKTKTEQVKVEGLEEQITIETQTMFRTNYTTREMEELITKWAEHYHVNRELIIAIAHQESGMQQMRSRYEDRYFRCHLLGKGCKKITDWPTLWREELQDQAGKMRAAMSVGIMQLMPYTAAMMARKLGIIEKIPSMNSLYDPDVNIQIGVAYVRRCINQNPNNFNGFAKCYNGPKSKNWGPAVKDRLINKIMMQKID